MGLADERLGADDERLGAGGERLRAREMRGSGRESGARGGRGGAWGARERRGLAAARYRLDLLALPRLLTTLATARVSAMLSRLG